jgi:hypothetical protein
MGLVTNLTDFPVGHLAGKDHLGATQAVCIVKATYEWDDRGLVTPAKKPDPIHEADVYAGKPDVSGLVLATDLGPPKPRLDVLLAGEFVFPAPIEQADVSLEVGRRLRKTVRVFGERSWYPGLRQDLAPSRPKPIARIPVAWEKSFGGTDPKDPASVERRNPVGAGLRRRPEDLLGHPVPSFDDPARPIQSPKDRPAPQGFGPIAPHWLPRASLAGTYDERWEKERKPLLPEDFNPAFFNAAPVDQQLDGFVAGEEVRLTSMTAAGRERFLLPDLGVPVTFVSDKLVTETAAAVDTIVISPAARRFSLVARASFSPRPTILSLRQIVVGLASQGRRRAIQTGKLYADWRSARSKEKA